MKLTIMFAGLVGLLSASAAPTATSSSDIAARAPAPEAAGPDLWPGQAAPQRPRHEGMTNAERLQRGLPLAKPVLKRLTGAPAQALASGGPGSDPRPYDRQTCFSTINGGTETFINAADVQDAVNKCAYLSATAADGRRNLFTVRKQTPGQNFPTTVGCRVSVTDTQVTAICNESNSILYARFGSYNP